MTPIACDAAFDQQWLLAKEIERKFMVVGDAWRDAAQSSRTLVQAYLAIDGESSVRVRILDGKEAWG